MTHHRALPQIFNRHSSYSFLISTLRVRAISAITTAKKHRLPEHAKPQDAPQIRKELAQILSGTPKPPATNILYRTPGVASGRARGVSVTQRRGPGKSRPSSSAYAKGDGQPTCSPVETRGAFTVHPPS